LIVTERHDATLQLIFERPQSYWRLIKYRLIEWSLSVYKHCCWHVGRHAIALCNELQVEICEKVRAAGGEI
jgi:hypothetical protein